MIYKTKSGLAFSLLLAGLAATAWSAPLDDGARATSLSEAATSALVNESTAISERLEISDQCKQRAKDLQERAEAHRERAEELRRRPITPAYKNPISKQRPRYHVQESRRLEREAADLFELSRQLVVAAMRDHLRGEQVD
jgi:hypothetical protein